MGIYNAANQIVIVLSFIPNIIGQVSFPIVANFASTSHNANKHINILLINIGLNSLVTFPLVILGILYCSIITRMYGIPYIGSEKVFVLSLITAFLVAITVPLGFHLTALGRIWWGVGLNLMWAASFIFGTMMLSNHGAYGIALSRCIAYLLHLIFSIILIYKLKRAQICDQFKTYEK